MSFCTRFFSRHLCVSSSPCPPCSMRVLCEHFPRCAVRRGLQNSQWLLWASISPSCHTPSNARIHRTLFSLPLGRPWAASAPAISMLLALSLDPCGDPGAWHICVHFFGLFSFWSSVFLEHTLRKELRSEGQTDLRSHSCSSSYLVKL